MVSEYGMAGRGGQAVIGIRETGHLGPVSQAKKLELCPSSTVGTWNSFMQQEDTVGLYFRKIILLQCRKLVRGHLELIWPGFESKFCIISYKAFQQMNLSVSSSVKQT